jgi:hypothetical protein
MKALITNLQKYNGVYLLILAVLFLILWFQNSAVNRYAATSYNNGRAYIIDTKTGERWLSIIERDTHAIIELGTPKNPKLKAKTFTRGDLTISNEPNQ